MTSENLIERCQAGDQQAFGKLLDDHYEGIYATAWHWCGDATNAQDITQNACIKLARNIHQFDGRAGFATWLHRLVVNCAKDFYKSPNQHNTRELSHDHLELLAPSQPDHSRGLEARQTLELITELSQELAETLILVFVRGHSHKQVAEQLDIKPATVAWRIHEARKQLRQIQTKSSAATSSEEPTAGATQ